MREKNAAFKCRTFSLWNMLRFVEDQLRVPVRAPWRLTVRVIINSAFFKIFMLAVIVMNFIFTLLEVLEGGSPEWSEAFNNTAAILYVVE